MTFSLAKDHTNPYSYTQGVTAVLLIIFTWPFLIARLYVRKFMVKCLGWDDILMCIAQVFFTCYCISIYETIRLVPGNERPSYQTLIEEFQWHLSLVLMYNCCTLFLKLSLGFFFLRVLTDRWQLVVAYTVMAFVTIINIAEFWFYLFSCGNPKHYAQSMIVGGCVSSVVTLTMLYVQFATNLAIDIVIVLLPMPTLWKSSIDLRAKWSVAFIFLLAGSGIVCSVLRVYTLKTLVPDNNENTMYQGAIYTIIEPAVFIIAGSLATMRPIIAKASPSRLISHFTNNKPSNSLTELNSTTPNTTEPKGPEIQEGGHVYVKLGS